jgi:hypothetical protein
LAHFNTAEIASAAAASSGAIMPIAIERRAGLAVAYAAADLENVDALGDQ